jgi:outer membrane protein assembly factor BamD (BamD/ComL family)
MWAYCIRIAATVALFIAATTFVHAQSPEASYNVTGEYMRRIYNRGIEELDARNYIIAHRFLSMYAILMSGHNVFNQNPQFRAQLDQALIEIERHFYEALAQRQTFQRDLRECQRRAAGGVSSRGSALTAPNIQLPRVPPQR